jgi:nucleosome binding factor SPN SPT16 subunit
MITNFLKPELETLIVEDKKITHKKLSEMIEEKLLQTENLDICFPPLIQSGGKYSTLNEDVLKFDTIICKIGTKFQGYCSVVERTFMIDSPKEQEDDYHTLEKIYKFIITKMKVNMKLKEVYESVLVFMKSESEENLQYFTKSIGYGIGLDKKEEYLEINASNEYQITNGNVFVVSIGFDKPGKYKLALSDTVLFEDGEMKVLTKVDYLYGDVSYSIDDEEEQLIEEVNQLDKENIIDSKRKKDTDAAENRRKKQQEELLKKKREESKNQKTKTKDSSTKYSLDDQLADDKLISYASVNEIPSKKNNRIEIDDKNETVLLPINGYHVPFHIATIKNVSKSEEGEFSYLRVNFKNLTHFGQAYAPSKKYPKCVFLKEISIRSKDPKNIIAMSRSITALKKKVSQREKELIEQEGIVQQENLELLKSSTGINRLRDVVVRPNLKGKKTVGRLESHKNGIRFTSNRNEVIDLLYANIKHAFYQPATPSDPFVLIHFHLYHPIMIGKKKTEDVQFYTEVIEEIDQLVGRGRKNMSDRESMDEEKRQNAYKQKLNNEFHAFSKKMEEISSLEFDMPYRDLEVI